MAKPELKAEAIRLRSEGRLSNKEISGKLGVSKASVSGWLKGDPLTPDEKKGRRNTKPKKVPREKAPLAEPPFQDYRKYVYLHKGTGRKHVALIHAKTKDRKDTSLSRYLMCVHLRRKLEAHEHVDHIDEDKTNDDLDNLQILTARKNSQKTALFRGKQFVELRCPLCKKVFSRPRGQTPLSRKHRKLASCSRSCSVKIQNLHKPENRKELEEAIKNNVIREYRIDTNT